MTLALFLFALLSASAPAVKHAPTADADEGPKPELVSPMPHHQPKLVAPVVVKDRYEDGLFLALGAGGGFAPSGPLRFGGSARLSVGYIRPEHADHLGVTFDPSLQFAWNGQSTAAGSVQTQGLAVTLPVLASGNFVIGPGLLRVLVGPSIDNFQLKEQGATGPRQDRGWYLGVEAGVQYLFTLPVGLLGLDARFHYAPYKYIGQTTDGVLFSIGASYAFTH